MPLLSNPFARRAGTVLFAATLSTTVAACGGGSSAAKASPTTTSTTAAAATPTANRAAFRTCMASHGITIPTRSASTSTSVPRTGGGTGGGGGGFGGGAGRFLQPPPGVDPTAYQNALNACRSLLPTGGGGGGANSAQFRTAFTAYVNCLRSHGVTTGDPSQPQSALANVDRTSPTFLAASQACRALLPQRGSGTTTTTVSA